MLQLNINKEKTKHQQRENLTNNNIERQTDKYSRSAYNFCQKHTVSTCREFGNFYWHLFGTNPVFICLPTTEHFNIRENHLILILCCWFFLLLNKTLPWTGNISAFKQKMFSGKKSQLQHCWLTGAVHEVISEFQVLLFHQTACVVSPKVNLSNERTWKNHQFLSWSTVI